MYRQDGAGGGRRWSRKAGAAGVGVAAAAAQLLAGCGSTGGSSGSAGSGPPKAGQSFKGQTLTIYDSSPVGSQVTPWNEYYQYLKQAFHQQTGATLNIEEYASGSELSSKIESAAVSGSGPDMFSYGSSFIGTIAATHDFTTLTPADWNYLGGRSGFVPTMLEDSGTSPSADIGIPFESIPFVIAYNKSLFAKAGITSPPATWSQYITDAQKVQAANPGVYGAGFDPADKFDPWKFVWSYTHQMGGSFVAANDKSASMDSPQVKQALQFYFEQYYQYHIVPPQSLTWDSSQMFSAFSQGKVAMMPLASYGTQVSAAGTPLQGKVAFAPLPNVPYGMSARPSGGEPAESIVSGNYWAIPSYAGSKIPLALDLAKISVSPATQVKQFQLLGWMPVTNAGISAVDSAGGAAVKPFIAAEEGSTTMAVTPAWSYVEDGMEAVMTNLAAQLATSHSYNASYANSQLATEQSDVTSHLSQ
jgi:multiple sugar transport system substrate-binding protein